MNIIPQYMYNRILLKISGEYLQSNKKFGIDIGKLDKICNQVKHLVKHNIEIGIVVGGGNFHRGRCSYKKKISRIISDQIGILATVMNGLAIKDRLEKINVACCLVSSIGIQNIVVQYSWRNIIDYLSNKHVVIFVGGTGNPFFSTDSAACLKGIEINADVVLKGTTVDGIYAADPKKNKNLTMYKEISYDKILKKRIRIMDLTAIVLAKENKIPIRVFNLNKPNILLSVVRKSSEGTLITF